jgi:hypothetical protein
MMWFVLAGLLLARKAFSTAAQVAYTVHIVFIIKTVCLHYDILEMHSFPMSAAKHFYDNPLSIYTVRKMDLILRPIERRPQMQFSMSRRFKLQLLRRYSVKFYKMRKITLGPP